MRYRFRALAVPVLVFFLAAPSFAADASLAVTLQSSHTEATLLGLAFRTPQLGWAVGSGGTILKTTDGGKRWKKISSGTSALLTNVYFLDQKRGWAIGANGTIRRSMDGGESWTAQMVEPFRPSPQKAQSVP